MFCPSRIGWSCISSCTNPKVKQQHILSFHNHVRNRCQGRSLHYMCFKELHFKNIQVLFQAYLVSLPHWIQYPVATFILMHCSSKSPRMWTYCSQPQVTTSCQAQILSGLRIWKSWPSRSVGKNCPLYPLVKGSLVGKIEGTKYHSAELCHNIVSKSQPQHAQSLKTQKLFKVCTC